MLTTQVTAGITFPHDFGNLGNVLAYGANAKLSFYTQPGQYTYQNCQVQANTNFIFGASQLGPLYQGLQNSAPAYYFDGNGNMRFNLNNSSSFFDVGINGGYNSNLINNYGHWNGGFQFMLQIGL